MEDTCIMVGDVTNSGRYSNITLISPRGRPMSVGGDKPFIEVNAQKTRIFNVSTRTAPKGAFFSTFVQVDDDQAFLLDGLDTNNYGTRCDASRCDPAVTAPGPFNKWSAVGWLKNLNISLQCTGNGVEWQSGNTLRISDSVIQGFSQFGVRGGRRGGYGGIVLDNVYEEVGNCKNPLGNIGQAGVIAQGHTIKIHGGEAPIGKLPLFANTGTTEYRYYVVARHAQYGTSNPLYVGKAMTNGSGSIRVTTPDIEGAISFDLLRASRGDGDEQAPFGTANTAVLTSIPRSSACHGEVCEFVDPLTPLQRYTVATPTYFPVLDLWPGNLILSSGGGPSDIMSVAVATVDNASGGIVGEQGTKAVAVIAQSCPAMVQWTPIWISCLANTYPPTTLYDQSATLLAVKPWTDGGKSTNLKGRLNFSSLGTGPGHIITLSDSNFQKTIATANNRPTNDTNDAYIGYDQGNGSPANVGLSLGAPKSLSSYIANPGDGKSWKERLTATEKSFAVPVVIEQGNTLTVGAGSAIAQMKIYKTLPIAAASIPSQQCMDLTARIAGLVPSDQIAGLTPPGSLGNLSLSAYVNSTDTVDLHFCNASIVTTKTPSGTYSFLAVH